MINRICSKTVIFSNFPLDYFIITDKAQQKCPYNRSYLSK